MRIRHLVLWTGVLLALATGGYFVTQLALTMVDDDPSDSKLLPGDSSSYLSICVDGAGGAQLPADKVDVVRASLDEVLGKQGAIPPEYRRSEVSRGCPAPSEKLGTRISSPGEGAAHYWPGEGDPSPHRLFVYFVPRWVYDETFSTSPYSYGPAEFACSGDECVEVTLAVYLLESSSEEALGEALARSLGLLDGVPNPEPNLDWSACERGEQPHPDHSCDQYDEWQRDQGK